MKRKSGAIKYKLCTYIAICSVLYVWRLQLSCIVLFISRAKIDAAIQCTNHTTVLSGKVRYMVEIEFYRGDI